MRRAITIGLSVLALVAFGGLGVTSATAENELVTICHIPGHKNVLPFGGDFYIVVPFNVRQCDTNGGKVITISAAAASAHNVFDNRP